MKNILRLLTIASFATFTGCVNSDEYTAPVIDSQCADLTATKPVSIFTGSSTPVWPAFTKYTGDDIIEAYVTSSDEGGNFYKSISLVSLTDDAAISIPVDDYNLYTKYPPGTKVFVNVKDLYYQKDADAYVVGALYNNNTPTDTSDDDLGRLSGSLYQSIITRACTGAVSEETLVHHVTIQQGKSPQYLNKLIEFDNVQFADTSVGRTYFDVDSGGGATNHVLTDIDGNTVITRVSQYANFISGIVPAGNGKVRGVMTKFGSTYQFMIRTERDVMLDNPRVVPTALFEETFTTNFANWTKQSVVGAQVWTLNAANGNPTQCADMNGFSSGSQPNEDWLISPAIDLTGLTNAKLYFETAKNFSGNALQVYVSTNYTSGAPTTATWTLVPTGTNGITLATASNFVWTPSGNYNIASYIGNTNFRVAFKYTSTASAAAQWRVDNVKVVYF